MHIINTQSNKTYNRIAHSINYKIYSNFVCTHKLQLAKMVNGENRVTIKTMYTL